MLPSTINPEGIEAQGKISLGIYRAPVRLKVSQWADKHAHIPRKGNAEPGKYTCDRAPYQRDMLDDAVDPRVVESYWQIASQLGKTLCFLFINGYFIHQHPSPILVVYPKLDDAESYSKNKFTPMLLATPVLRDLIKDNRERDSGNTILEKAFPGGEITMAGANSPSTLRQKSKRVVMCDEIDGYEPNKEGDPLEQADTRATTFYDAVKLKSSTPTDKDDSAIEEGFEKSDMQYWFCTCPRCGVEQTLKWAQIKWTFKDENGSEYSDPENAVYVCENCNEHLSDFERIQMVRTGRWKATAPFTGIRGRHMNGIYRIIGKKRAFKSYLHEFVTQFLAAKAKGRESLRVWTNTFLAETWEDEVQRKDATGIMERAEVYEDVIPEPVLVLVGSVDVQADRLECLLSGFGAGEEYWGISRKIFYGSPHRREVWQELTQWYDTEYQHPCGRKMRMAILMVDSGGQSGKAGFAKAVYQWVGPRQHAGYGRGCYASKGIATLGGQMRQESRMKNGILLQKIGTDENKSMIYNRLDIVEPGPRRMHYPKNEEFDEEFYKQLVAEQVKITKHHGYVKRVWEKKRDRNEALDLTVMAFAALDKLQPQWNKLAILYKKTGIEVPKEEPPEPPEVRKEGGARINTNRPKPKPKPRLRRIPPSRRRL